MSAVVERGRVGQSVSAIVVGVLFVAACAAIAAGIFSAAMAAMGRGTAPEAEVRVVAPVGFYGDLMLPCVEGWSLDGSSCEPAASPEQWPGGQSLPVRHAGDLVVDGGPLELGSGTSLLGSASSWLGLVAAGTVGLLLLPVLRSTASGRPFAERNDLRLAGAAGVVLLAWAMGTIGDYVAGSRIVHLLESTPVQGATETFTVPDGWLEPVVAVTWWPLAVVALLVGMAAATRGGARLASETEGLV